MYTEVLGETCVTSNSDIKSNRWSKKYIRLVSNGNYNFRWSLELVENFLESLFPTFVFAQKFRILMGKNFQYCFGVKIVVISILCLIGIRFPKQCAISLFQVGHVAYSVIAGILLQTSSRSKRFDEFKRYILRIFVIQLELNRQTKIRAFILGDIFLIRINFIKSL